MSTGVQRVWCPVPEIRACFVAIKMGRRQGARRARILKPYVTDEQRSRRPIFIATLRAAASWLFFRRRGGSLRIKSRYARRSRLEKQPTDQRRNIHVFRGQDTSLDRSFARTLGDLTDTRIKIDLSTTCFAFQGF